ncbi:phosphotransferase family protein [Rhodococcus aetherivorans]
MPTTNQTSTPLPLGLADWMDAAGVGSGPIGRAEILTGGTQHLMIGFERGGKRYVLRQAAEAESSEARVLQREIRVLSALSESDVPHAPLVASAPDGDEAVGPTFYLVDYVDGVNLMVTGLHAPDTDRAATDAMAFGMASALAALTKVTVDDGPLQGLGRPEGFLARQPTRWMNAIEDHARTPGWDGISPAQIEPIISWLEDHLPDPVPPSLMHGDYQVANVLFHPTAGAPTAIIDWEMATVGDPRLDLGWMLSIWPDRPGEDDLFRSALGRRPHLPSATAVAREYETVSGINLVDLPWFRVMAALKFAVVLEGGYAAALRSGHVPPKTTQLHGYARALFDRALQWQAQERSL